MTNPLIPWPTAERVELCLPSAESEDGMPFALLVPKGFIGRRYVAAESLRLVRVPEHPPLVRFGMVMVYSEICLDSGTGQIITLSPRRHTRLYVNESLTTFSQLIDAVVGRFPFYGKADDSDEWQRIAGEVAQLIGDADPEAMIPDRFWSTFVDDLANGDFPVESFERAG